MTKDKKRSYLSVNSVLKRMITDLEPNMVLFKVEPDKITLSQRPTNVGVSCLIDTLVSHYGYKLVILM